MAIICRNHKLLFIMVPGTACSTTGIILSKNFGGNFIPQRDIYKNHKRIVCHKHNSIKELVEFNLISRIELAMYLKFATVRNPFDKFATEYQRNISEQWIEGTISTQNTSLGENASKEEKTHLQQLEKRLKKRKERLENSDFETWLERRLGLHKKTSPITKIRSKFKRLIDPYHMPKAYSPLICGVDEVIRFECLEEDFNALLKKAGIIRNHEWITIPKLNLTPGKKPYQEYYTKRARALVENTLATELEAFSYQFE